MKKLACLVLVIVLLVTFLVAAAPAGAQPFKNASHYCKWIAETDPVNFALAFDSHGDCVSTLRSTPTETCKMLDEQGELESFGWKNRGQCVQDLKK